MVLLDLIDLTIGRHVGAATERPSREARAGEGRARRSKRDRAAEGTGGDNNLPSLPALSRVKTDQFTLAYLQRYKYDPIMGKTRTRRVALK
jgi:hypothetical protein